MEMTEIHYNHLHHIDYLLGTSFNRRMYDVYTGMGNPKRPPFLDDILRESSQMQALLILENTKESPWELNISEDSWRRLYDAVWQDDEAAKWDVFASAFPDKIDNLYYDTLRYLEVNHMSILIRRKDSEQLRNSSIVNAPVIRVW